MGDAHGALPEARPDLLREFERLIQTAGFDLRLGQRQQSPAALVFVLRLAQDLGRLADEPGVGQQRTQAPDRQRAGALRRDCAGGSHRFPHQCLCLGGPVRITRLSRRQRVNAEMGPAHLPGNAVAETGGNRQARGIIPMKSAVTVTLVPETRSGPFVFSEGLADAFVRAAALGFDGIEIFPSSAGELDAREVRALCARHGLKVAAVGTGAGWVRHKLRLTDADAAVRRQAVEFVARIIDFGGGFGAPAIIGSMQGRAEGTVERAQALAWLAEALEELGPRAEAGGVPLLYEFLNRYETNLCNNVAEALELIQPLRTRNVRLLCDLFHMNIDEADLAAALRRAGSAIGH
ncbi:MAG: sugar phosphate isomerase/epimerase, partial [Verrucomicrobia bacterium]|nr:sugar phosphate isomerase/epimerase [Verrucomicrobiota bacterium]